MNASTENVRRLAVFGCAGSAVLCLGLVLAPFLFRLGGLGWARWRWAQHGGSHYSMVVEQACVCYHAGEFRLTVENGRVTRVEPLAMPGLAHRLNPASFDHLTVEAAFERAGQAVRASWLPRRFHPLRIEYDPAAGYVRRFETDNLQAFDARYLYTARDLQLTEPR